MSKKLLSTILLFAVGIGFLLFGLNSLIAAIHTPDAYQAENIIFSVIYLAVAIYAFGAIFALPRKSKG
jgi:hypothetical protein